MVDNMTFAILKPGRLAAAGIAGLLMAATACAQTGAMQTTLQKIGIDQKLGAQVPPSATVRTEDGKSVPFGTFLGKRPIVFLPIFYNCQGVCGRETDSIMKVLVRIQDKSVGKDYDVVLLSIHPKETPELAQAKKNVALGIYDRKGAEEGFHFLTGSEKDIRSITDAIGFRYEYDAATNRINHPAGIMVLTPGGRVSQYLYGADYPEKVVRSALDTATKNGIGYKADVELLGCIMIDPVTGKRSLVIENFIRLIAAVIAEGLLSWIGVMSFRHRRSPVPTDQEGPSSL
jgi:protein SCO1/2